MPIKSTFGESANLLIAYHSANAAIAGAMRADALLAEGDIEGTQVWNGLCAPLMNYRGSNGGMANG
jgi:hypothetical protein